MKNKVASVVCAKFELGNGLFNYMHQTDFDILLIRVAYSIYCSIRSDVCVLGRGLYKLFFICLGKLSCL